MRKFFNFFNRIEEILSSLFLGGMILIIAIQVFNRYVLQSSLSWSEELGRYLFIWAVFIGCSYASLEDRHLAVTVLRNYVRPRIKILIIGLSCLLTIFFCVFCAYYGIKMLSLLNATGQQAQTMDIKIYYAYLSIPVGFILMALRNVQLIWQLFKGTHPVFLKDTDTGTT